MTGISTLIDAISVIVNLFRQSTHRVLCYHKVGRCKCYYTITADEFKRQMPLLEGATPSFDDGTEDGYATALPILLEADVKGIFFIMTDNIGKRGYLSREQIAEMAKLGMIIGSHSCSHPNLETVSQEQLTLELVMSQSILEGILGKPVDKFAYPYGKCSDRTRQEVMKFYSKDYTTAWHRGSEFRTTISGFDTLSKFQRKVNGAYAWLYKGVLPLVLR